MKKLKEKWLLKFFRKVFFLYIKITTNYYQKPDKKSFEENHAKDIKIFLTEKKNK